MQRKRRVQRKKRSNRHKQNTMTNKQMIVADNFKTKIAYVDIDDPKLTLSGVSVSDVKTFRLNGLHDPNRKINSSSAVGHLTLSRLYNRYHITGCRVDCAIANGSALPIQIIWHAQSGVKPTFFTSWGAIKQFEANNDTIHRMVGLSTGSGTWKFSRYYSQKELEGGGNFTKNSVAFNLPVESDPSDEFCFNGYLYAITADGGAPTGTQTIFYDLKLTYFVTYFERRDLANTTVLTEEQEDNVEIVVESFPGFDAEEV